MGVSVLLNRENVLRMLDSTLAALQSLRNDIYNNDSAALEERLGRAHQGREKWWQQRQAGEWMNGDAVSSNDAPTSSDVFGRLLGLGRRSKPKK